MAAPLTLSFPSSSISFPRYICYGMEFIFWICYFISATVFLKLLWKTRSVHQNLRFILANMCIDYLIAGFTRFFILYNHINLEQGLNPQLLYGITLLAFVGLTAKTASEIMLLIERFVSTIFANKYEKMKSIQISVIFCSLCYIYPCITLPLLVNNVVTKKIFIPVPIIFDVCSWIFTIMLLKINNNTYVCDYSSEISIHRFSLTKRYQTVENIRTLRAIVWFLIYSTISNAVTVSFHAFNTTYFNEFSDKEMYAMCDALWYMINPFVATLLPLPFIFKHDDMRKHFMALIKRRTSHDYSQHQYKTVIGGSINMNNDADTHFMNLKSLWMEPGASEFQRGRLMSRATQIGSSTSWIRQ